MPQSAGAAAGSGRPAEAGYWDIKYIWTAEGWLYLAVVMDLYSRRIVG
jgi:transposase InsO family protein